ncbi:MAG: hypothetical protein HKN28_13865 [Alphaproteobacteria bacterium]|nr:hypothetical protein [Alphaproteobacteria bacterium]
MELGRPAKTARSELVRALFTLRDGASRLLRMRGRCLNYLNPHPEERS